MGRRSATSERAAPATRRSASHPKMGDASIRLTELSPSRTVCRRRRCATNSGPRTVPKGALPLPRTAVPCPPPRLRLGQPGRGQERRGPPGRRSPRLGLRRRRGPPGASAAVVALGVGAAASVVAALDHRAATALSGVGAGLTAAVQAGLRLRRGLRAASACSSAGRRPTAAPSTTPPAAAYGRRTARSPSPPERRRCRSAAARGLKVAGLEQRLPHLLAGPHVSGSIRLRISR